MKRAYDHDMQDDKGTETLQHYRNIHICLLAGKPLASFLDCNFKTNLRKTHSSIAVGGFGVWHGCTHNPAMAKAVRSTGARSKAQVHLSDMAHHAQRVSQARVTHFRPMVGLRLGCVMEGPNVRHSVAVPLV